VRGVQAMQDWGHLLEYDYNTKLFVLPDKDLDDYDEHEATQRAAHWLQSHVHPRIPLSSYHDTDKNR